MNSEKNVSDLFLEYSEENPELKNLPILFLDNLPQELVSNIMDSEKNVPGLFLEYSEEYPEIKNFSIKLFLQNLPQILVANDLDDLYFENELQALMKIQGMFNESSIKNFKWFVTNEDFLTVKGKIEEKLESLKKYDPDEAVMILFYAVSSVESMINSYLHDELSIKELSENDIKKIYKLSFEEKLGWFLKLICNVTYTDKENWKIMKKYVEARNFYIHYKPSRLNTYYEYDQLLKKNSMKNFLEASCNCYFFLKNCHTKEYKNKLSRIEHIESSLKEKYSEYY